MKKRVAKLPWSQRKEQTNTRGWVQTYRFIFKEILNKCDPTACVVYWVLLSYRNTDTNVCNPSLTTIAEDCGVSESTVSRAITRLQEEGFLNINSGSPGVSSNYYFPKELFYNQFNDDSRQFTATRRNCKTFKEKKEPKPPKQESKLKPRPRSISARDMSLKEIEKYKRESFVNVTEEDLDKFDPWENPDLYF